MHIKSKLNANTVSDITMCPIPEKWTRLIIVIIENGLLRFICKKTLFWDVLMVIQLKWIANGRERMTESCCQRVGYTESAVKEKETANTLLGYQRFQCPLAFFVYILAMFSELSFYITYMFTSACECHGNVSSECHCLTATPRNILIHHPRLFSLQISTYTESHCLLPACREKQSHT